MIAETIKALMRKTTFAADESGPQGRMDKAGLKGVSAKDYRLFFGDAVIGSAHGSIILHRDTCDIEVCQSEGTPANLPQYLADCGIVTGIKVDAGMATINGHRYVGSVTELPDRLKQLLECGARFAKFRFAYGPITPRPVLEHGAMQMAIYASACLEMGIVPFIEPELERSLLVGHSDKIVLDTTNLMLNLLMAKIQEFRVVTGSTILKTNLLEYARPQSPTEIAAQSFELLQPWLEIMGGVKLLSGGQTSEEAFARTAALAKLVASHQWNTQRDYPRLSTSFSRAAMEGVLEVWAADGRESALQNFHVTANLNADALRV